MRSSSLPALHRGRWGGADVQPRPDETYYPHPTFLIIGAAKSGTTTLARAIGQHPNVYVPRSKEAHHFGRVPDVDAGGARYRRFFADWQGECAVGEATPYYLYLPAAARQIAVTLPNARLVAILRNPVDRAYSSYWHGVRRGVERLSFVDALVAEPRRLAQGSWGFAAMVDTGRYLRQLQRFERLFGRDRLHVILTDDLIARPVETLDGVASFLGLPLFRWPPFSHLNPNQQSLLPRRLRRSLAERRRDSVLATRIFRRSLRPFTPPPMPPQVRRTLVEIFQCENEALGRWLGRDLTMWER